MPKKKIVKKKIRKGKFYHFHEGSPSWHPGMVFWKNDNKNLYLSLTTDTSKGEHRTKLMVPTEPGIESYVNNRPLLSKRKNISGARSNLKFDKEDKNLLRHISQQPFRTTADINRKDKRFIKAWKRSQNIKKPFFKGNCRVFRLARQKY